MSHGWKLPPGACWGKLRFAEEEPQSALWTVVSDLQQVENSVD